MKNLSILVMLLLVCQFSFGQNYTNKMNGVKKVSFQVSKSDLWIEAYDGNEIIIEAKGFQKPPSRADGLKPLYNTAVDNTGIGLDAKQEGNVLYIKKASSKSRTDYKIKIPKKSNIYIEDMNWESSDITVVGVQGEIEIKGKGSDLKLMNIVGPVVAHTISGDIEVVYASITPEQPNSISATSGYVDVTLPKNTKANMSMSAISGEIYTDFTLEYGNNMPKKGDKDKDGHKHDHDDNCCDGSSGYGNKVVGKINGGGVEIALKAISGNIYLRQAK